MAELPHLQDFAEEYGPQKFVVLGLNAYDNNQTITTYQNLYPDVLMLKDPGWTIYTVYRQNGYIPLNYVITPEQTVDYFMEGFNETLIRNHIEALLPEVTVVLTPDSDTVPQGGVLSFNVTLTNFENSEQSFFALTQVQLPGGTTVTLLGPVPVTINPNGEISVNLEHNIPGAAPLGTYKYTAKIGTYPPADLMDISTFEFEVVAP